MILINRDELIHEIKECLWDWKTVDGITSTAVLKQTISDINSQPTIEVICCGECKHGLQSGTSCHVCCENENSPTFRNWFPSDWFCANGEPKEHVGTRLLDSSPTPNMIDLQDPLDCEEMVRKISVTCKTNDAKDK